jgi:hypothetical protein
MWLPPAQRDPAAHHQLHGSLRRARHGAAEEVTMKASARSIVTAVALAALTVLPVGGAHADPADDQWGVQACSGPGEQTRACQALQRTLAREHHASPAPSDQQAQAARRALQRTLAREPHAYPAAADPQQHTNPSSAPIVLAVTGAVGLSVVVVVAAASSRRRLRAWSHPQGVSG